MDQLDQMFGLSWHAVCSLDGLLGSNPSKKKKKKKDSVKELGNDIEMNKASESTTFAHEYLIFNHAVWTIEI